jgi:hypothetical protein
MGSELHSAASNDGEPNGQVIFSYLDGFVWASWPGAVSIVRVGEYEMVTAAMQDFLAQCDDGERLLNQTSSGSSDS